MVIYNDKNQREEIDVQAEVTLSVGSSGFYDNHSLVSGGHLIAPQLEARFKWNPTTVYFFKQLM